MVATVRNEGADVVLSVVDDGPGFGMDPDNVFERFFRADRARTRRDGATGTGLGLSIVRAVAVAHGGEAWAENRPEGGACVSVRFPHRGPPTRTQET